MPTSQYSVTFWNVENLFDVENFAGRSEKLRKRLAGELAGWDNAVLTRKISQLAAIIRKINGGKGPDLLGVCEVENERVLSRLATAIGGSGRNYRIAHADSADGRGIDVAFLYDDAVFTRKEQFQHSILKRSATRDLVQVNFELNNGKELIAIGNHWPSRMGGRYESEPYRILAGETLAYFHERIREIKGDDAAIIAMGDFNDEPFDRSLVNYALSNRQAEKVRRAGSPRWLNLMWPILGEGIGTHYFQNVPNVLDQFLVSKGMLKANSSIRAKIDSVKVERFPEMVNDGAYPSPIRFGRPSTSSGHDPDGYSDHFPISIQISAAD